MSIVSTGTAMAVLANLLTDDQKKQAADQLRGLSGDDVERKFYENIARSLENRRLDLDRA